MMRIARMIRLALRDFWFQESGAEVVAGIFVFGVVIAVLGLVTTPLYPADYSLMERGCLSFGLLVGAILVPLLVYSAIRDGRRYIRQLWHRAEADG